MERVCEEFSERPPPCLVQRGADTVRPGLETTPTIAEVSSQTEEQKRCDTVPSQPQSVCVSKKGVEDDDKTPQRVLWYPEITLFDTEETDSYVFVFQTETKKVTQTDLREPEPPKNRRLAYLAKGLKFLFRMI